MKKPTMISIFVCLSAISLVSEDNGADNVVGEKHGDGGKNHGLGGYLADAFRALGTGRVQVQVEALSPWPPRW